MTRFFEDIRIHPTPTLSLSPPKIYSKKSKKCIVTIIACSAMSKNASDWVVDMTVLFFTVCASWTCKSRVPARPCFGESWCPGT